MLESSSCTDGYINRNIDLVKGWNGFIDKNGRFYPVSPRNIEMLLDDESIQKAATELLNIDNLKNDYKLIQLANPEYRNIQLSNKDILVYIKGYIIYNYSNRYGLQVLHTTFPKSKIANTYVTAEQVLKGEALAALNNDNIEEYYNWFNTKVTSMEAKKKVYRA